MNPCLSGYMFAQELCLEARWSSGLWLRQVWEFSHGEDSRPVEVPGPRKSVGAQITYGVRLDSEADAEQFLERLAGARTEEEF